MPRAGELTYYESIGDQGRWHAQGKPFTDPDCGLNVMQVGAIMCLLPDPPAKILDCGCGPGWLAYFLAKRGYEVTGADVSPQAVELARSNFAYVNWSTPRFVVADLEELPFENEFDAVLFFDSLHHAVDEQKAMNSAFRALKPGGRCITSEPAKGHAAKSVETIERFDVTEKDMPPTYVRKLGKRAGFRRSKVYPRPDEIGKFQFVCPQPNEPFRVRLFKRWPFNLLAQALFTTIWKRSYGIVVLEK
jgi:SAM-dependent methyltransferase